MSCKVWTGELYTPSTMAKEGRGIAWLPQSVIKDDLRAGLLLPAGGPRWHIPVEIRLYRQRSSLSAAVEALRKVVDNKVPKTQ